MSDAVCIGCGYYDDAGGCSWLRIAHEEYIGVCSSCPEHVARWDAGEREFDPYVIDDAEEQEARELREAMEDTWGRTP